MIFGDSIVFMQQHLPLLLAKTGEHLLLAFAAIGASLVVAVPVGVWLGHIHKGNFVAVSVANIGRALPTLALIAVFIGLIGLGFLNVFTALVVIGIPPILTNAYLAVEQVEPDLVRAGRGMGLTGLQVLTRIELPLALPLLFAGLRTAVIYVIGSAAVGGVAGSGGLGDIILREGAYGLAGVIAAAFWVAALAILGDLVFLLAQRAVTPRGLRRNRTATA